MGLPSFSSTLQEVGILLTLVYFQFYGLFGRCFPKGLFGKIMGYGNNALF